MSVYEAVSKKHVIQASTAVVQVNIVQKITYVGNLDDLVYQTLVVKAMANVVFLGSVLLPVAQLSHNVSQIHSVALPSIAANEITTPVFVAVVICSEDADCGGPDETCNTNTTKCEKPKADSSPGWVIAVIVVGVILFLVVFFGGGSYRYCRGKTTRGVVVEETPVERHTTIIALRETHIHTNPTPPISNSPPPPYFNNDQGYPRLSEGTPYTGPKVQPLSPPKPETA